MNKRMEQSSEWFKDQLVSKSTCFRYLSETWIMFIMLCVVVVLVEHISVNSHLLAGWVSLTRWLIETHREIIFLIPYWDFPHLMYPWQLSEIPLKLDWYSTDTWLVFNKRDLSDTQLTLYWCSAKQLTNLFLTFSAIQLIHDWYSTDNWLMFNQNLTEFNWD